jgi:hypothetical protein
MAMEVADSTVDIQINKAGPSGRPVAIVTAPASVALDKLTSVIQREITRNSDLRTKLGLKGCPACAASGIDLDIRHRFDHVLRVDLGGIG